MIRGLRLWPIVTGVSVDVVGSLLFGLGYSAMKLVTNLTSDGGTADEVLLTTTDYVVTAVFGLLLVVAGGYIAGRMARVRPMAHGLCVGLAVLAIAIVIELLAPDPQAPMWFNAASMIGVVPAAALGGRLSRQSPEP